MPASRTSRAVLALVLAGLMAGALVVPALADDPRDISVGGVWVTRLTAGTNGLSAVDRVVYATRQITEVLSDPRYPSGAAVTVRPFGADAAIMVGDRVVVTVTAQDANGAGTMDVARSWAARLAEGLTRARQGSAVYTLM